jgi:hypothetical protein
MPQKLLYFLILILTANCYALLAQEAQYEYAQEQKEPKETPVEIKEKAEEFKANIFQRADSLSNKPTELLSSTNDSLNQLSLKIQSGIQSKIDSLKRNLNGLKDKGGEKMENVTDKTRTITQKIDSLQGLLSDKLELNKLGEYSQGIPDAQLSNKVGMPELKNISKLSLLDISSYNNLNLGNEQVTSYTSKIGDRISNLQRYKDLEWIKADIPLVDGLNEVNQYKDVISKPESIDQMADQQASQLAEMQELSSQTKELQVMQKLPEAMLQDLQRYRKEMSMRKAKKVTRNELMEMLDSQKDKINVAENKLADLKKKYSYVPDSRDLSSAIKRNSLKNVPFKKRFMFGLNFQLQRGDPMALDLSPNLMYKFNKLFMAGISGTYRAKLGIEDKINTKVEHDVFGFGAIAQHKIWKGIFAHGEYNYLSSPGNVQSSGSDLKNRAWHSSLPVGIGSTIKISNAINSQIILTYDFLHNSQSPNPKAWNIKFGFQLGKLSLKGIKL